MRFFKDVLKNGQSFRLVGDNVDWMLHVRDERIGHVGHLQHAFASAVIVNNFNFEHLSTDMPQKSDFDINDFMLRQHDIQKIKEEYAIHVGSAITKTLPYFQKFASHLPRFITKPHEFMNGVNKVIPLPVIMKNEQSYKDVVQILENYENILETCYQKSGLSFDAVKIHIGGDQLTRERFSGAKNLRDHHFAAKERFDHLGPITFEFFHMVMNYVQLIFDELYDSSSANEVGTLKFLQERMCRVSVNANVKKAFDADKDFIVSITDVYRLAAAMHHFGMDTYTDMPTKNVLPCSPTDEIAWFTEQLSVIVNSVIDISVDVEDNIEGMPWQ